MMRLRLIMVLALCSCEPGPESAPAHAESRAALGVETQVDSPVTGLAAVRQSSFAAAFNGTQWMAAWTDQRMSNTGSQQVWGTRVSLDGGVLDPYGLQLTYGRGGNHPAVSCVPAYCWILWTDANSLEGVRIAPNGAFVDPTVVVFTGSTGTIADISLATNGTDFFTAWTDTRSGVQAILGKSLTPFSDGGFPPDLIISSGATARRRPALVSVDAGYLVAWTDLRGASADIWALQVLDAGSVLGPETQLSSASTVDDFVSAAVDPATGNVLVTWDTAADISGRRVRANAVPVDAAPFAIDINAGTQRRARTVFDGTQWVVAYEGPSSEQRATLVSTSGVVGTRSLVTAAGGLVTAIAASNGGPALMGWENQHLKVFVGNPNDGGFPEGTINAALAQSASAQFDVDVVGVDGNFLVVWQDSRADALRPTARWFTSTGVPAGASFDLSLTASRANRGRSAVAGPAGQALAMWMPTGTLPALQLTRVASLGGSLDAPPLAISDGFSQDNPSGAYGPGAYLVAVEEARASPDIYGFIVQTSGVMSTVVIATTSAAEVAPAVAGSSTQWLVAWSEGADIGFTRVDATGMAQPRSVVPGVATTRATPAAASDGSGFLLAWLDNSSTILGVRIDQNGVVLDTTPLTLATGASAGTPGVIWDGLRYLVTWRAGGAVLTRVVPAVGAPLATTSTLMSAANNHRSAVLAFGRDNAFVVAASNLVQAPYAAPRLTFSAFTESSGPTPCTVELECKTLSCVSGFCIPVDAGVDAGIDAGVDAGVDAGIDAGPDDAGVDAGVEMDAGVDEPDAGPRPPYRVIVGCGCSTGESPVLLLLFAALISRQRSLRQ